MSSENNTAARTNYASRLLSKMMTERTKNGARAEQLTAADAAKYAAPAEAKQVVGALK